MATVAERVAAGAALLDERRPDWFKSIDCASLDIASSSLCVCGQLYGSYHAGLGALNINGMSSEHGFSVGGTSSLDEVNAAWRDEIAMRRMADMLDEVNAAWREEIAMRRMADIPVPVLA